MTSTIQPTKSGRNTRVGRSALVGATLFLLAYLAVSPVATALADSDIPLPDAPASELKAFVVANPATSIAGAGLQAVSVIGFALFALKVHPALGAAAGRVKLVAAVSTAAMLASSALSVLMALSAPDVSADTVSTLRQASFYAGGVLNVTTLGFVVLVTSRGLSRAGMIGPRARILGYVAGTLALASVTSLAIYYANLFLPIGRILSMVWTVVAASVLVRHSAGAHHATSPTERS